MKLTLREIMQRNSTEISPMNRINMYLIFNKKEKKEWAEKNKKHSLLT